jgi:Cu/Zn superoxide dismutase
VEALIPFSTVALARRAAVALALAVALAGCETARTLNAALVSNRPALGGRIVALGGSSAKGFINVQRREGGVTLIVNLNDVGPGIYRVVFHTNGNCRSPNGFSAGPPWVPAGGEVKAYDGAMNSDGLLNMSIPIAGLSVDPPDGIYGRSVVVHHGATGSLDAEPGVRNNRIACVVLGDVPEAVF